MIYTLTLNPSIDYYMNIDNLISGQVNRSKGERIECGGKGINVSLMLKALGCESRAVTIVGGLTGKAFLENIHKNQLECMYAEAEGNTRINVKLSDSTEINGAGIFAGEDTVKKLFEIMQLPVKGDYVIMSGSICRGFNKDIYASLIKYYNHKGVLSVVDTSGEPLKLAIKEKPWLIKPNIHELGEIFDIKIKGIEDVRKYAYILNDSGVKNVLVTMGDEGAFFTNGECGYFCKAPQTKVLSTVGAGDCALAGFVYKYLESNDFKMSVDFAVKCGSKRAETGKFSDICDN